MERRTFFGAVLGLLFGGAAAIKTSQSGPVQAVNYSPVLQDISLVSKGGEPINTGDILLSNGSDIRSVNTKVGMSNFWTEEDIRKYKTDPMFTNIEQSYHVGLDLANGKDVSIIAFTVFMPGEKIHENSPILSLIKDQERRSRVVYLINDRHPSSLCMNSKRILKITSDRDFILWCIPIQNEIRMNFGWADERVVQL